MFVVQLPKPAIIFYYDETVSYTVKNQTVSVIFIMYMYKMYQVLSLDVLGDIALLCFV